MLGMKVGYLLIHAAMEFKLEKNVYLSLRSVELGLKCALGQSLQLLCAQNSGTRRPPILAVVKMSRDFPVATNDLAKR
jgi:hypothetical protein